MLGGTVGTIGASHPQIAAGRIKVDPKVLAVAAEGNVSRIQDQMTVGQFDGGNQRVFWSINIISSSRGTSIILIVCGIGSTGSSIRCSLLQGSTPSGRMVVRLDSIYNKVPLSLSLSFIVQKKTTVAVEFQLSQ
jgi:hypothetical protein